MPLETMPWMGRNIVTWSEEGTGRKDELAVGAWMNFKLLGR